MQLYVWTWRGPIRQSFEKMHLCHKSRFLFMHNTAEEFDLHLTYILKPNRGKSFFGMELKLTIFSRTLLWNDRISSVTSISSSSSIVPRNFLLLWFSLYYFFTISFCNFDINACEIVFILLIQEAQETEINKLLIFTTKQVIRMKQLRYD